MLTKIYSTCTDKPAELLSLYSMYLQGIFFCGQSLNCRNQLSASELKIAKVRKCLTYIIQETKWKWILIILEIQTCTSTNMVYLKWNAAMGG